MKTIVKPLFFGVLAIAFSIAAFSQNKISVIDGFGADMKKVIRDYPHHFSSLQGAVIEENPQSTDFECNFQVTGAQSATITRYSANNKNVYSWQALLLTTEDFSVARAKYKALFAKFNNMAVKMDYGMTFYLKGKYLDAVEERSFTSSIFSFELPDQITRKMKLEISLQYESMEWKLRVLIYEKDREDTERGEELE